jgi:Cadherin domain
MRTTFLFRFAFCRRFFLLFSWFYFQFTRNQLIIIFIRKYVNFIVLQEQHFFAHYTKFRSLKSWWTGKKPCWNFGWKAKYLKYLFAGGNNGNKFNIDLNTGELTARPLDREQTARYLLQITAQDRGTPTSYQSTCNITIIVEDQNDNDPRFELPKYVATIAEDVAIGTSVISVKAIDSDLGINARIVYSLANETEWLFNIDNHSGLITTAG